MTREEVDILLADGKELGRELIATIPGVWGTLICASDGI